MAANTSSCNPSLSFHVHSRHPCITIDDDGDDDYDPSSSLSLALATKKPSSAFTALVNPSQFSKYWYSDPTAKPFLGILKEITEKAIDEWRDK